MDLDILLLPEHRKAGLHLMDDEDFVYLYSADEGLGIFHQSVPLVKVLETADRWVKSNRDQKAIWQVVS